MPLDLRRLRLETFVGEARHFTTLGSTSDYVIQALSEDPRPPLPLLISADEQTAGRGRSGNRWWSAPGALMFTLGLESPAPQNPDVPPWSLLAGLAVHATIRALSPRLAVQVKWPNDVFANGRKVAGILIEVPPTAPDLLVIGIGVNLNNSFIDAPASLRDKAASLFDLSGMTFDATDSLIRLLGDLERELTGTLDGTELAHRWSEHCLLTGRQVAIRQQDRLIHGRCSGIDVTGGLVVESPEGTRVINSGVVESW